MMSMIEMRKHVIELTKERNIRMRIGPVFRSAMATNDIEITGLETEENYAATLHEIGHQVLRNERKIPILAYFGYSPLTRKSEDYHAAVLRNENQAWIWAKQNAIKWTERMHLEYIKSLTSYMVPVFGNGLDLLSVLNKADINPKDFKFGN